MPKLPPGCPAEQEICAELEQYLQPCECGGVFKKGASPRCPRCALALSAEAATAYIERKRPEQRKGGVGKETGMACIASS
jgi:hypothetical protein